MGRGAASGRCHQGESRAEPSHFSVWADVFHFACPWPEPTALLLMSRSLTLCGGMSFLLPALTSRFPGELSIKGASVHIGPILLPSTKPVLVYSAFLSSHSDFALCSWGFDSCFSKTWTSPCYSLYGNLLWFIQNI